MRRLLLVIAIASCGRRGFEPIDTPRDGVIDVTSPVDTPAVCGAAYKAVVGMTSRYRMGGAATTWQLAERDCESDGGHLPVIDDAAENAWVESQVVGWLGLTDHVTEGTFLHVTGMAPVYSNWNPSEPSDTAGSEDCGAHYVGIEWNDYPCSIDLPYVCECDLRPLPSPAVWCTTGQDSSCNTCDDACPVGQTCSASQICM